MELRSVMARCLQGRVMYEIVAHATMMWCLGSLRPSCWRWAGPAGRATADAGDVPTNARSTRGRSATTRGVWLRRDPDGTLQVVYQLPQRTAA
jgi:hypothetical protein